MLARHAPGNPRPDLPQGRAAKDPAHPSRRAGFFLRACARVRLTTKRILVDGAFELKITCSSMNCFVEHLEPRRLLSSAVAVTLHHAVLTVRGTAENEGFFIAQDQDAPSKVLL